MAHTEDEAGVGCEGVAGAARNNDEGRVKCTRSRSTLRVKLMSCDAVARDPRACCAYSQCALWLAKALKDHADNHKGVARDLARILKGGHTNGTKP